MANLQKSIIKNSTMGLFSQITSMVFLFITRNLFIKYIGIELLGINGTFASVLSTLSLAELGFQTAVVHSMYDPLVKNNQREVNNVVNVFKYVYRAIGIVFIVGSLMLCPFLKKIITGIDFKNIFYIYFLIQASSSAASYFLAYKRSLLFADQKDYISKEIDMVVNIIAFIFQVVAIYFLRSYICYIAIKLLQTVTSNTIIHLLCRKLYPYLKKDKVNKGLLRKIVSDVKSIFIGKIASYVYTSTDNLVISALINTSLVGVLSNYTVIITNFKSLLSSLLAPMAPVIGQSIAEKKSQDQQLSLLNMYTHFRYVFALIIVIPLIILLNTFIELWVGAKMCMSKTIVLLIGVEFYIHLVHSSLCDYISGEGLFKEEKYISIIAAVMNLSLSIILAIIIGVEGVLIGTVISQSIFWIGRSIIVFKNCFSDIDCGFIKYWIQQMYDLIVFAILICICESIYRYIAIENPIIRFIAGGIACEIIIIVSYLIIYHRTSNFKALKKLGSSIISRRILHEKN